MSKFVRVWVHSNIFEISNFSSSFMIMSLETDLDREVSSSTILTTKRNFLIVPSFNPDRRHSWGNVVPHHRNAPTSVITITTNAASKQRWEEFITIFFFSSTYDISQQVCVSLCVWRLSKKKLTKREREEERERKWRKKLEKRKKKLTEELR